MKQQSIWNMRIPSLVGIALLVVGILVTGWVVKTGVIFTGRAAPGNTPQDVVVTNITDSSFTVTYKTSDTVLGTIAYKAAGKPQTVALDIRDQKSNRPRPYQIHAILVNNLNPGTQYAFKITSGGGNFSNNGKDYAVTTSKKLTSASPKNPVIKGKVATSDGSIPTEAIVYLRSDVSQTLSGLSGSDGTYSISTAGLRTKDLHSYVQLKPTTKLTITALSPAGKANVAVLAKGTNPVPLITLSNTYDFAFIGDGKTKIASQEAAISGFPEQQTIDTNSKSGLVTIISPKDGQALSDQRPTFKGTAPPNAEIEITIDSDEPTQANVMSDRKGTWTYRPKSPLPPGAIGITVNARDGSGITKSANQSLTILAAGSTQFTEPSVSPPKVTATPSPTPKRISPTPIKSEPTPTDSEPSPTEITPTKAIIPVATPTAIELSPTPTVLPTIAPTVITTILPTNTTPIPTIAPTGDNDAILYALIGAVAISIGAVLLFLTGGISL